jgi:MFS family permease
MASASERFESIAAFREVFANRNLRRVQLAMTGSTLGHWGYTVALVVWAYDAGGGTLVGVATFVRILPAAVAAPFLGALADRYERRLVMVSSDLVRAASLAVAAVAIATDLPVVVVLVAVSISAIAQSIFWPSLSALMPSLTSTPEQLTAANVTTSAIDGLGMFVGPAIGGLLLVATSPQAVFVWTVACMLWSAALVSGVRPVADAAETEEAQVEAAPERIVAMVREGFAAALRDPSARLIVSLFTVQTLIAGYLASMIALIVFELLDRGASWVGYLEGAIGVGGLVGVLMSTSLVGRRDLAAAFGVGVMLFGAPLVLVAGWSSVAVALVAMALIGVGNAITDVSGVTLLQRATDDAVRARVFSVLETAVLASMAVGGLAAPLLADAVGLRAALVAGGLLPVVVVLAAWRPLRRLDLVAPPTVVLDLLRRVPLLAPLSAPVLERLALEARELEVPAGQVVFEQGAPGDSFYVIADGEVDVSIDGSHVRRQAQGEGFGEIALLRDTPRTATITAIAPSKLVAIDRDAFLSAVTGHPGSAEAAEGLVAARLAHARPAFARV